MPATDEADIAQWLEGIITGLGGLHCFETYELAMFKGDRDIGVAHWVIRCLGNIECENSGEVLQAITDRRKHLENMKVKDSATSSE